MSIFDSLRPGPPGESTQTGVARASRPLVRVTAALVAGTKLGQTCKQHGAWDSHQLVPGARLLVAAGLGLALVFAARALRRRARRRLRARAADRVEHAADCAHVSETSGRSSAPPTPGLAVLVLLATLGGLRAWSEEARRPESSRESAVPASRTDTERRSTGTARLGAWHPADRGARASGTRPSRGRGWVDPGPAPSAPAPQEPASVLVELDFPPPPTGAAVGILPGSRTVPFARGPVAGPSARAGNFDRLSPVHPDELVRLEPPSTPSAWTRLTSAWRAGLSQRARRTEGNGAARGLVRALLLGNREGLDPGLLDLFTRTGTRHLLALSGLHVALLFGLLVVPLSNVAGRVLSGARARVLLASALRLLALFVFLVVCGHNDPVRRATCAAALCVLAPLVPGGNKLWSGLGRRPDPLQLIAVALLYETLADPTGTSSVGLQLSYVATAGLLVGLPDPLVHALSTRPSDALSGSLDVGLVRALRAQARRAARLAWKSVLASAAAMLATLPLVWETFGEVSPMGVLATPLALPFIAALLMLGATGLLAPNVLLDGVLRSALNTAATGLTDLLELVDRLPGTPLPLPPRPFVLLAVLCWLPFWVRGAEPLARPLVRWIRRGLPLAWSATILPWCTAPRGFELFALEVGHGSCFVARAPGWPCLIFDAGSRQRPIYREALAPLLAKWDVRAPLVWLSHEDRDHVSSWVRLAQRYPPALHGGAAGRGGAAGAGRAAGAGGAAGARRGERIPHASWRWEVSEGRSALFSSRNPTPLKVHMIRGLGGPGNEGSRSIEVLWRGRRMLVCGDAEGIGLERALERGWMPGPLELLVFPHHGSDTDCLAQLLERLTPREVWISAEEDPAVARELERRGVPWRGTHREGPLALFLP